MKEQFPRKNEKVVDFEINPDGVYSGEGHRFFNPDGKDGKATFNPLFDKLSKIEKEKERDDRMKKDRRSYENKASYELDGATPIGVLRRKITEKVPIKNRIVYDGNNQNPIIPNYRYIADPEKVKENLLETEKINALVEKIKSGAPASTPEEIELYKNNSKVIEEKLRASLVAAETEEKPVPEKNKKLTSKNVANTFYKGGDIPEREQKFYERNKDKVNKIIKEKIQEDPEVKESFDKAKEEVSKNLQDFFEGNRVKDNRVVSALDKMNISEKEILYVAPDFLTLNGNQQIYVLEKIRQKVAGDATIKAERKVEESLNRKTKLFSKDSFKKIFQRFTKENEEAKARKELLDKARESGLRGYEDDMRAMTNHVKNLDLKISHDSNGKLKIEYVDKNIFVWSNEYKKRFRKNESPDDYIDRLNESATALSELPYEWGMPGANIIDKMKYKKALTEYNKHKSTVFGAVAENDKISHENEKEATLNTMLWANSLDSQVKMNQLLTTHPDLEKYGSGGFSITGDGVNPANAKWGLEKMGLAMGVGARMISRRTFEAVGATVAAGVLGGVLAGRKKWFEYSQKEKKKRYGETIEESGVKKYIEAESSANRIRVFLEKIETTTDEDKKSALLRRLQNHLYVVDERVKEGRVNFGDTTKRMSGMLALNQAVAEANALLFVKGAQNENEDMKKLFKRFNSFQKDSEKNLEKGADIARAVIWGAIKSGAFAGAGFLVADYFHEIGSGQSLKDRYNELLNEGGDGKWNDVEEGVLPGVKPEIKPVPHIDSTAQNPSEIVGQNPPKIEEVSHPQEVKRVQSVERPKVKEILSPEEKFIKEMKANIREIKTHDGDLARMEIRHLSFVDDVAKFRKNAGEFLIDDMSKSGLPENMQTRSFGIRQLISVKGSVEQFLGWKDMLKAYPDGTPQHEWIEKEMMRLGENIRSNVGNIFKPYEEMAPSLDSSSSIIQEGEVTETPQVVDYTPEPTPSPQGALSEKDITRSQEYVSQNISQKSPESLVAETSNIPREVASEDLIEEVKENVRVKQVGGVIEDMDIKNVAKVEDVIRFRKNPGNFLIDDLSKSGLPDRFETKSWGTSALTNARSQVEEFLAWREYIKVYPDGTPQHEWIENRMDTLGKEIRGYAGKMFKPFEDTNITAPEIIGIPTDATANVDEGMGLENVALETSPESVSEIRVNENIVSKSFDEEGNLDLDFHDKDIEGHLKFIEGKNGAMIVEENSDFHTSYGKEFRSNPQKFISDEDVEKVVRGWSKESPNINARKVLDRFEDFINKREALKLSGLPLDSKEALALKSDMARIDSFFEKHTGTSVLDRLKLVETGVEIEPTDSAQEVAPEHPNVVETAGPDADIESKVIGLAVEKYGQGDFEGNVVFFDKGYVGFYKESIDYSLAKKMALSAAELNKNLWSGNGFIDKFASRMPDGTYRVLIVYKQKE